MRRFWNFSQNTDGTRTLHFDGIIAEESWYGDEITPKTFRDELMSGSGDVTIWLNSPGGDVFAAAQIYNMLMEYPNHVIIKIDGIAASAASVIAMAGSEVLMSPVSLLMVHNPTTFAIGDRDEMQRARELLDEVKQSIINAYELKTGLGRTRLSNLMDAETWMDARRAVNLGFADGIMYQESETSEPEFVWNRERPPVGDGFLFSRQAVMNSIMKKLPTKPSGTAIASLDKRLMLLKNHGGATCQQF